MSMLANYFKQVANLPEDLVAGMLRIRSHPSHLSNAIQAFMTPTRDKSELHDFLRDIIALDSATADLQFAESYLLEGTELMEAQSYLAALTLFEMGNRLCQAAIKQSPNPTLATAGQQLSAECQANMGLICINLQAHTKARRYLSAAREQFESIDNLEQAVFCLKRLHGLQEDPTQEMATAQVDLTLDELIEAAEEALYTLKLLDFIELSLRAIPLLDDLPLEQRIHAASKLVLNFYLEERRTAGITHLQKIYEVYPNRPVLQEAKYLWLYFARMRCYGGISNATLLYFVTDLANAWSVSIPQVQDRILFRQSFSTQAEEAFRWALTQRHFLLALRIADQLKARSTNDLLLARRHASGMPELDVVTHLLMPNLIQTQANTSTQTTPHAADAFAKHWFTLGQFESHIHKHAATELIQDNEEQSTFVSVNAARRLAPFDSLLLEYAWVDDLLHVFAAPATRYTDTQGKIEHWVTQVGIGEGSRLQQACRRFRTTCRQFRNSDTIALSQECIAAGQELYQLIIGGMTHGWNEPAPEMSLEQRISQYHRLIIIPTGPLASIPWHALRTKDAWFWQTHLFSIVPSLSLLWAATYLARPMGRDVSNILLIGNPKDNLPASVVECKAIAETVSEDGQTTTRLLLGAQATLKTIQTHIAACDVLHVAAHALFNEDNPAQSYIVLADAHLTAQELAAMNLENKAVVLSCCESGMGKEDGSDDVFALAHACLIGGARYVVASLWPVEDEATSIIMRRFYHYIVAGYSPHLSLNLAIKELVAHSKFDLPYFWAPFQLFGAPEDVDVKAIVQQTMQAFIDTPQVDVIMLADPLLHEKRIMNDLRD